ncbi:ABC transporter permease [Streptomyces sp. NBC_00690]|uniref:ABC transporter permease n=1 Tax=Streptomyces sp. NBC_00690 TaxID=2975808 RepID=UPI002E2B3972|nr:ABC transporter permease [Streptomyces sp. NBC_00690]
MTDLLSGTAARAPGPDAHRAKRPAKSPLQRVLGGQGRQWLLLAPAVLMLLVFFAYPLADIVWRAFTDPEPGVGNFSDLLADPTTGRVMGRTLLTSLVVAVTTLLLAYPYAYLMTVTGPRMRAVLMALVLLPFWTSLMARNFAWIVLLQDGGPLGMLGSLFGRDGGLLGTAPGVAIGMVQVLLPYMVLPLYSVMSGIDRRLMSAASGLGAGRFTCFRRIYLPLSMPGVISGTTLVFVLALGFYVTPKLLGSPKESMVAQVIGTKVEKLLDFGGAGAFSVILLALTALLLVLVSRVSRAGAALGLSAKED